MTTQLQRWKGCGARSFWNEEILTALHGEHRTTHEILITNYAMQKFVRLAFALMTQRRIGMSFDKNTLY